MTSIQQDNKLPQRDLLGHICFWLHIVVLIYIVSGWALPWHAALYFYLGFLPLMAVHWWLNANSCVLNNLESLLRSGRWRDPTNREEGQWLLTLINGVTGLTFTPAQIDALNYAALVALWGLGLWHLRGW